MASRTEALLEADRRGILPPDMQAALDEAKKRGLVAGSSVGAERPNRPPPGTQRSGQDQAAPAEPASTRLGIVDPAMQAEVRGLVQGLPDVPLFLPTPGGPVRMPVNVPGGFLAEAGPATAGTTLGALLGSLAGPVGAVAGGSLGGLLGELVAQETGVTPESDLMLGLAAAGPVAGPLVAKAGQLAVRGAGGLARRMPSIRAALADMTGREATETFERLGSQILSRQQGAMAQTADELYTAVREAGVVIGPQRLRETMDAISKLSVELAPFNAFPDVRQSQRAIAQTLETLSQNDSRISIGELVDLRQLVGTIAQRAQNAGGMKLHSADEVFQAISRDLDSMAASVGRTAETAQLARTAIARAKLEFSVQEFEGAVARFTREIPGSSDTTLNIKQLRKWLLDTTNPAHPRFNKNFTDALGNELPEIRSSLSALEEVTKFGTNAAGPGSIVVRNIGARTGAGVVGFVIGGPVGAGAGAMLGAQGPELIVAALLSPRGRPILQRLAEKGGGELNAEAWSTLGQVLTQSATSPREERGQ